MASDAAGAHLISKVRKWTIGGVQQNHYLRVVTRRTRPVSVTIKSELLRRPRANLLDLSEQRISVVRNLTATKFNASFDVEPADC